MSVIEKFIMKNISSLAKEYSLRHGANVNLARMAPDYVHGLKPVAKRALYIMFLKDQGKHLRKMAAITGETAARLHHHAPSSVYGALVGLAQWWNNNIPLVKGKGNFGTVSGDPAGADRYIQACLSEYAYDCFFSDWKESVVDMELGADKETMEPVYLPAKYPNVLLNGATGIGFTQSSNIPPFNFNEIVNACIVLMKDPNMDIVLIPDSPTGADIIACDFKKISDMGNGSYSMRCKYEICPEENMIRIISLPYQVLVSSIVEKIADIKEKNGLPELVNMKNYSGVNVNLELYVRDDINPYKFMKKLINEVGGLERSYNVGIVVTNECESFDFSIKRLLNEWISYRRDQKRVVVNNKRTNLLAEQRTNDVKIFLMSENNLDVTVKIFKTSHNRAEIEERLIQEYKHSAIRMDSLQARTLSGIRGYELSIDAYKVYLVRRDEILKELAEIENVLTTEGGIDRLIIGELKDGVKKYGSPRKSCVVPEKISVSTDVAGECILQLSSDGTLIRNTATNVVENPVPTDSNGFAVKVENDSSFIAVDEFGMFSFIRVSEIPVDQEVPLNRFIKQPLGNIVGLLPFDIDSQKCVTLISASGIMKKIMISEMRPSKKPCMDIPKGDRIVRGVVTSLPSQKDLLICTRDGFGQRLDPNTLRITSFTAKGTPGFKLQPEDQIIGCYYISPEENQYLVYVTTKGKMRLNLTEYLPQRNSKHDEMVRLIMLPDRDKLIQVVGCNRMDKIQVWFDDKTSEIINISKLEEGTMSSEAKKATKKNAVSNNIVKARLV